MLVTAINYLDRNALSVAQTVLEKEFGITNTDYGRIVSVFLLAYGLMHPVAGRIVDWLGIRRGLALAFVWWSLASIGHAFARGVYSFGFARIILGLGESANFPAAIKTVREWFPAKDRALATGIFNVGAGLGAVLAPPVVGGLILVFGWQAAFVTTGAIGLLWLIPWLWLARRPEEHPRITPEELAYIQSDRKSEPAEPAAEGGGVWKEALSRTDLWILMAARFLTDPVWYFFTAWIPKYFKDARGFDLKSIALFTWVPFLASDVGSIAGGWISLYLARRGFSVITSRKIAMCCCASLMPIGIFAVYAEHWQWAIVCLSFAAFGHQSWAASVLTLPADLFPKRMVAVLVQPEMENQPS